MGHQAPKAEIGDRPPIVGILVLIYGDRFILWQLQGEAHTFAQPDVGSPVNSFDCNKAVVRR